MADMHDDPHAAADAEHPDLSRARTLALLETLEDAAKDARMLKARINAAEEADCELPSERAARRAANIRPGS
jgi:hypothetical protein